MTKKELKRVQVLMSPKLYQQLRKYSFSKNQSLSKTNRQALQKFFNEIKC